MIDVLVPAGVRFGPELLGGRSFDGVPGLLLALAGPGVALDCEVLLLDGAARLGEVVTLGVESAVVVKALATRSRAREADLVDLTHLLEIVARHPWDDLGGWRLDRAGVQGARRDAALALHAVADRVAARRASTPQQQRLAALVRTFVARG